MFKRLFWLMTGLSIGFGTSFWAMRTLRRTVERYAPQRLAGDVGGAARRLSFDLRDAVAVGRTAMKEREQELRQGLQEAQASMPPGR